MKHFYSLISFLLILISNLNAQFMRASIGPGSLPNRVKIYLKPDLTQSASISTLQFNLGILPSALPAPTVTVVSSIFTGATWTVGTMIDGGYRNYFITTSTSPLSMNCVANTEVEAMEVQFSGGPMTANNVSLVTLPDGGSPLAPLYSNGLFYCTGTIRSSGLGQLYYQRNSSVSIINLNSYDPDFILTGTGTSVATIGGIVLPTKFLSFFANKSDDNAKLTWTVDNEEDNSYFEVEASKDARTFNKILKVDALRNGRSSNTYTITDMQISRYNVGTVYYRIKQVEASGKITYTDVRQVNLDSKNFVAALYPNPVKTVTKLMIEAPEAAKATVIIRDAAGKAVKQLSLQLQKGTNQQNLDVTSLATGDYNVTIVSDKLNQTIKMTKSN